MKAVAGMFGALAVAAGAFGTHALRGHVPPERLDTWHTAASYQLAHAVVLLILASTPGTRRSTFGLFTAGILVFSGSLYVLVLLDLPILGAVTPLGGIALILGWLSLLRR
jgi:uncharacterized membrane protein YgdD (TMEM256/DUF423 family)